MIGNLLTIVALVEKHKIRNPAIIIVGGEVVKIGGEKLAEWRET